MGLVCNDLLLVLHPILLTFCRVAPRIVALCLAAMLYPCNSHTLSFDLYSLGSFFACHVLFVTASMLMTAQRDLSCWNHMLAVSLLLYPCLCRNGGMFFALQGAIYFMLLWFAHTCAKWLS